MMYSFGLNFCFFIPEAIDSKVSSDKLRNKYIFFNLLIALKILKGFSLSFIKSIFIIFAISKISASKVIASGLA